MTVPAAIAARRSTLVGLAPSDVRADALVSTTAWLGVCALAIVAPFERTTPLLQLPGQSVSSVETALLVVFAAWLASMVRSRVALGWRTPLTSSWIALLTAMLVAAAAAPVNRANALHMVGRLGVGFGVYLITVSGVTTPARLGGVLVATIVGGVLVGALAVLEYLGVGAVLQWLQAFRAGVAVVGAQVRAGGPFQYPTIASMYLEIAFAFGLGLLLMAVDMGRRPSGRGSSEAGEGSAATNAGDGEKWGPARIGAVAAVVAALAVISEAITLTFTRAGFVTMASSVVIAGALRYRRRGLDAGVKAIAAITLLVSVQFSASHSFESMQLRLTTEGQTAWYRAKVDAPLELTLVTDEVTTVPVTLTNSGRSTWDSAADQPFRMSYHWLLFDTDRVVSFWGLQTDFPAPVPPGATVSLQARVHAPRQPGRYRLLWDIHQEHRLWFSTEPGAALVASAVTVNGPAVGAAVRPTELLPLPRVAVRPGRLVLWRAAARMFAAHPVVGVGPDNFRLLYGGYAGLINADPRIHSNNMYLEMLVGGGAIGGLAFAWFLWRAATCLVAAVRRRWEPRLTAAAAGIAAAGAAVALHGIVDSFFSFTATYVLISLTLGLAVACGALNTPNANRV